MVGDSVGRGFVRLVDVDSLDGAAKGWRGFSIGVNRASVLGSTTDGVIEDEDFRGAGAFAIVSPSGEFVKKTPRRQKKAILTLPSESTLPPGNRPA